MNRTVIALGFFDGVHRGHGALLEKTAARARELEAVPAAFTFDRPPKEVVTGRPVGLINTPDDRRDLMQRLYGIRQVIIAPFDRAILSNLVQSQAVERNVAQTLRWAVSDNSLRSVPKDRRDDLRASIFKQVLIHLV